ncbi:MAG TPA: hypothetical protein VLT59_10695 [Steroidobacteraceae bacterium]|nr:hypothetical protein [Steroidobacteraceae bacterium]
MEPRASDSPTSGLRLLEHAAGSGAAARRCALLAILAAAGLGTAQAEQTAIDPAADENVVARWLAAVGIDLAAAPARIGSDPLSGGSLGQRISRYLALETSHLAIGMTPLGAAATAGPPLPHQDVIGYRPATLSGIAILPAGDFSLYARFGLTTSLQDAAALAGTAGFGEPGSSTLGDDLLWGVGIGYQFSDRWSGRFDFQQVPVLLSPGLGLGQIESRYDLLSIGLTYDF